MKWLRVSIPVRPEAMDAVSYHCLRLGSPGIEESTGLVRAYLPVFSEADPEGDKTQVLAALQQSLAAVREVFGHAAVGQPASQWIDPEDWAESWKPSYRPLLVGRRCHIVPEWLREQYVPPAGSIVIWMEPGMAFGTGEHASTRLALALMEIALENVAGKTSLQVIDVGTGSGILAIAAAHLAGGTVWACDQDPVAVEVARNNAAVNGVAHRVTVEVADLFRLERAAHTPAGADVLVANILYAVLRDGAPILTGLVRPGGWLVLSGLITEQRERLLPFFTRYGCRPVVTLAVAGWAALLLRRVAGDA